VTCGAQRGGYIAIMAANLSAAKQSGQFAAWAEPEVVARHMYGLYVSIFLAWAADELDMKGFRNAALSGICHLLVGVTLGAFHEEALARLKKLYKESPLHKPKEVRHAAKSRR
jgi:hypothetical protein